MELIKGGVNISERKGVLYNPETGEVFVTKHFNIPLVMKEWA